jgi:HSP20 family molecular chaperone IbpA
MLPPGGPPPLVLRRRRELFLKALQEQQIMFRKANKKHAGSVHAGDEEEDVERTHFQTPPTRWEENEETATLTMDVAGFSVEDLQVSLHQDHHHHQQLVLCLSGKRQNKIGDTFVLHRRIVLDQQVYNVDRDIQQAYFSDGVLEITIPKHQDPKPEEIRWIPIHGTTKSSSKNIVQQGSSSSNDDNIGDPAEENDIVSLPEDDTTTKNARCAEVPKDTAKVVETVVAEEEEENAAAVMDEEANSEGGSNSRTKPQQEKKEEDSSWEEVNPKKN